MFDSDDICPDLRRVTASPQPYYLCLSRVFRAVGLGYDLGYWYMSISDVRSRCTRRVVSNLMKWGTIIGLINCRTQLSGG